MLLGSIWAVAFGAQIVLGVPIETYIQLSSGNFLLTYVLIVVTAWRLLPMRRFLAALLVSSLAILALVVAGFQSLWYALAIAALFALFTAVHRATFAARAPGFPVRDDAA